MVRGNSKVAQKSKAKPTAKRREASAATPSYIPKDIPLEVQQKCLDIFRGTFQPGDGDGDGALLQEVKGHLYDRDFAAAFGKKEYLRVYALRWSPSRTLGYVQVLADIQEELMPGRDSDEQKPFEVVCLGGGAGAEVVALAGWKHLLQSTGTDSVIDNIHAEFADIAAWDTVVKDLHRAVTTPPELSKYASAAAKEANVALVQEEGYTSTFHQLDVLQLSSQQSEDFFQNADLVTLMFTLNELYSTSMRKTQQMLSQLTSTCKAGAYLLVVDSPGSYSTVSINGAEKKYPMQWLLDHTLVGKPGDESKWEKLVSDDSRWFRLPQGLEYPIELENMRYQIHVYRKKGESEDG